MRDRSSSSRRALAPLLLSLLAAAAPAAGLGLELSFEAESGLAWRGWNEGFFAALGTGDPPGPVGLELCAESGLSFALLPGLSFLARGGIEGEGRAGEASSSSLRAYIPEALVSFSPAEVLFLRAGILSLPTGSDPYFRPAYWPSRFVANAFAKGGTSFLAFQASAYLADFKLGLLLLPELGSSIGGLFQRPEALVSEATRTGSAAEARVSYAFLGGQASLFGFGQSTASSLSPRFGGLGLDAAFPLGEWADARGECLYSSGLPAYETRNGAATIRPGSSSAWGLAWYASVGATLFSLLEIRAGYADSSREDAGRDASLSLSLPRITDALGMAAFLLLSPEDLSSRGFLELFYETREAARLRLRGELSPSSSGSVHGSGPIRASISLRAEFAHSERL
jgi:hypothetical protein